MTPPPCIHSPDGRTLCEECRADYDEDSAAYVEFGAHTNGIARWQAEQALIDRDLAEAAALPPAVPDPSIPF